MAKRTRFSLTHKSITLFGVIGVLLANGLLSPGCQNPFLNTNAAAVSPPTFSPAGGVYGTDQEITIETSTSGAAIHYTLIKGGVEG